MIDNVLYYGYNPNCSRSGLSDKITSSIKSEKSPTNYNTVLNEGKKSLRKSIKAEIDSVEKERPHVVPLSAGLDSRTILAALLEAPPIDNESIITISFGTPGTWDFEIGQRVARIAGVDNRAINITIDQFDWSEASIRSYAKNLDCPTRIFEGYVNHSILDYVEETSIIWSGFFGETTAGSHQPDNPSKDWTSACEYFNEHNRFSEILSDLVENPMTALPEDPYLPRNHLCYEEQLDFAHRQPCFISPLVLSKKGTYATPFTQPEWLEYSLNLPHKYRENRSMFVDIVTKLYPKLFSIESDMKHGLPPTANMFRWYLRLCKLYGELKIKRLIGNGSIHPGTNYLDFESEFRDSGELRSTVKSLIRSFEEKKIRGINAMEMWKEHQNGFNREKELRTICSLEVFLDQHY